MPAQDPRTPRARAPVDIRPVPRTRPSQVAAPEDHKPERSSRGYLIFVVVLVALVAPQALYTWKPLIGAYAEFAAFGVLVVTGLVHARSRKLAVSAAILPMAAIVALCLPKTSVFVTTTIYYCTILLFGLVYAYMTSTDSPYDYVSSVRSHYFVYVPLMIVLGEILGAAGFLMLRGHYLFSAVPLATVVLFSIVFAASEAILFQGLIQQSASEIMHPLLAGLLAVFAYASAIFTSNSPVVLGFGLIAGVVMAGVYFFRQNVVLITCANAVMKLSYLALLATFVLH